MRYILNNGLTLVIMMLSLQSFAQSEVVDDFKEAIKAGNSKECAKYFNESVDVTIEGDLKNYSKTQAEYVLRDFFKANPPSSFTTVHQGSSKGGLAFAIGQYKSKDKTYRVWMRLKKASDQYLIHEISFLKE